MREGSMKIVVHGGIWLEHCIYVVIICVDDKRSDEDQDKMVVFVDSF